MHDVLIGDGDISMLLSHQIDSKESCACVSPTTPKQVDFQMISFVNSKIYKLLRQVIMHM